MNQDQRSPLRLLLVIVGEMNQGLQKAQVEQATNDMLPLTNEIPSENPRRRGWELSVEGLKEAASAVGGIGKPVLTQVSVRTPIVWN